MLSGRVVQAYFREVVDHILMHCFADFVCKEGAPKVEFLLPNGNVILVHEDQF